MRLLTKELSIVTITAILSMGLAGCGSSESDRFDDPNSKSALENEFKPDNDNDGDGLLNGQEDTNGNQKWDEGETDFNNKDTDGDGLWDGNEVNKYLTNPINPDSDDDGVNDGKEVYSCDESEYDTQKVSEHTAANNHSTDKDDKIDALDPYNDSDGDKRSNLGEKLKGTPACDKSDFYPWVYETKNGSRMEDKGAVYVPGGFDVDRDGEVETGFWFTKYPASATSSKIDARYNDLSQEVNSNFISLTDSKANYNNTDSDDIGHAGTLYKAQFIDKGNEGKDYMNAIYAFDIPTILTQSDLPVCQHAGEDYPPMIPTNKQYTHVLKLQEASNNGDKSIKNYSLDYGYDINVEEDYQRDIYHLLGTIKEFTKEIVYVDEFKNTIPSFWESEGRVTSRLDGLTRSDTDIGFGAPGFKDNYAVIVRDGWAVDLTYGVGSGDNTVGQEIGFRMSTCYLPAITDSN